MATPTTVTPSRVPPETVERAVTALLKWRDTKSKTQKPQLLDQDEFVYLVLTLKNIPAKAQIKPIKIPLPHPLYNPTKDNTELCLIIDDRSKSHISKDAVKRKIEEENIPVSKILKLSKLKSDYGPFEAKRKLCDSYDLFLTDRRVVPLLPKLLGKHFFRKRKIPVTVDLLHKNWKEQVERACGSGMLYLRTGTCCVVKVGRVSMGRVEVFENVVAAIDGVGEAVPRKWGNLRSLHLKLLDSLALPVYQAVPDVKLRIESGVKDEKVEDAEEDVVEKVLSKVEKKKKGRISEIRYMDREVLWGVSDDEDGVAMKLGIENCVRDETMEAAEEEEVPEKGLSKEEEEKKKKKKKKKGRISEVRYMDQEILVGVSDDEDSDAEIGVGGGEEVRGKKRKNVGEVKGEKVMKKADKEKEDGIKAKKEGVIKTKKEDGSKPKKDGGIKSKKEDDGIKRKREDGIKSKKEDGSKPKKEGGIKPRKEGGIKPKKLKKAK